MNKYFCICCNYDAKQKSNYEKHLQTKKHKKLSQSYPKVTPKLPLVTPKLPLEKKICCKYCNQEFKYKSGLSRHIKYTCKKNEDEDLQELVKLLNEIKEENKIIKAENMEIKDNLSKEILKRDKELAKKEKQVKKLTNKLQINTNNNCIINNNKIKILNYKDTDLSHLTNKDYVYCISRCNNSIKTLSEMIHFNPEKPENMNVFKSNLKNDYISVVENDEWVVKKYLEDFMEDKELILEDWLNREGDKHPGLRDKFNDFISNKENENILNNIKDNLQLLMYNNRNKVKQIKN